MLTTDANGFVIRTGDRVEVSLVERARSAGVMRAIADGQRLKPFGLPSKDNAYKLIRCKPTEVTQEIWEEFRSAYLLERDGVPF